MTLRYSKVIAERHRAQEALWAEVKAAYYRECERMNMPPRTTLAAEAKYTRERARQVLGSNRAPQASIEAARRLTARLAMCKPKPNKKQEQAAVAARKRVERAKRRAAIADLVVTVNAMTTGYGRRGRAAAEIGINLTALSSICTGTRYCGEATAAKLAAWVERNQS